MSATTQNSNELSDEIILDKGSIHHIIKTRAPKLIHREVTDAEIIYTQEQLWLKIDELLKNLKGDLDNIKDQGEKYNESRVDIKIPVLKTGLFANNELIKTSNEYILSALGSTPNNKKRFMCIFHGHKITSNDKKNILSKKSKSIITECRSCKMAIQVDALKRNNGRYRYIIMEL